MKLLLRLALPIVFILFVSGCSTIKDAKNSIGNSPSHIYAASFDDVWLRCIDIINQSELDLVYENRDKGDVLAQRSISAFSWGENVFINVFKISKYKTQVKISSKRTFSGNITAESWDEFILSRLGDKYQIVENRIKTL